MLCRRRSAGPVPFNARVGTGRAHADAIRSASGLRSRARRIQIDPRRAAPADRGEAAAAEPAGPGPLSRPRRRHQHVQGPHRRHAVADRQAEQVRDSAGLFRCRDRAAGGRIRRHLRDHGGAARERSGLSHAVQGRRRSRRRDCARQRAWTRRRRRRGPHQPGAVLCRDQRQAERPQCAFEHLYGQPADRPVRGPQRPAQMGGDQGQDRSRRSRAQCARRQGRGAIARHRPPLQPLDQCARRPHERACGVVCRDPRDREDAARSDRADEAVRAGPDHPDADAVRAGFGRAVELQGVQSHHHEAPAQQQHLRLRQVRPGTKLGQLPRNPRRDVVVQAEVSTRRWRNTRRSISASSQPCSRRSTSSGRR